MKTSLCANVQLNRSNFDFNLKIVTYALFPPGPSFEVFSASNLIALSVGIFEGWLLEARLLSVFS